MHTRTHTHTHTRTHTHTHTHTAINSRGNYTMEVRPEHTGALPGDATLHTPQEELRGAGGGGKGKAGGCS